MIRDLSDDEARLALVAKWGMVPADVLPAWVAEMDYALAPPITEALTEAVIRGRTGYPSFSPGGGRLGEAYAGFAARHFGQQVDPEQVLPTVDVTAGVRIALDALSDPGPVVLPVPAYHPQFDVVPLTGRRLVELPVSPDADRAVIDLDRLDRAFASGARTLLLTQPHNPCGQVYTRAELEGIRDVVERRGARVVSDEIHAPLVLSGATHVPYLSLEGTAAHAVAVVSSSKTFNTAGLKCAQILAPDPETRKRLTEIPDAQNDSWSSLGVVAAIAAYEQGDPWLASLLERLDQLRTLFAALLAESLPEARMRPLEATYLPWLDLRAYGHVDPARVALDRGRVQLSPGQIYHPGLAGHARVNIATSPDRLTEIVRRAATALT